MVTIRLKKNEVSGDTYALLSLLEIVPFRQSKRDRIRLYKETIRWLVDRADPGEKEMIAFSGEADPQLWNALEEELKDAVENGMRYIHCLGPVLCTDEKGRNGILEVYKEYPNDVELYLFRTRIPYHWHRFSFKTDGSEKIFYRLFGECYHKPLADPRKEYKIWLESEEDRHFSNKICYYYNRERDFQWLLPIMDKVVDADEIPSLTSSQLKRTCSTLENAGRDFNLLAAEEIIKLSSY